MSAAANSLAKNHADWKAKVKATGQRSWKEWIGKDGDTAIPEAVQLRVRRLWDEKCFLSGISLGPLKAQMEHLFPLHLCQGENGNRESNLRPVLQAAALKKNAGEQSRKAKADRAARSHAGLKTTKHPMQSRPKEEKVKAGKPRIEKLQNLGMSEIARRYQNK